MDLLIELQYLPCQWYFSELLHADRIILEVHENYQKQSYRNRCYILGANKVECLTVPVKDGNSHKPVKEIEIDYSTPWVQVHLRSIASAYGKSAYFEHFFDLLKRIYDKKSRYLVDLNLELLTFCLKLIKMEGKIEFSTEFKVTNELAEGTNDMRSLIHPKKESLSPSYQYTQVFGTEFVPNLSILDLLFCEGLQSGFLLRKGGALKRG